MKESKVKKIFIEDSECLLASEMYDLKGGNDFKPGGLNTGSECTQCSSSCLSCSSTCSNKQSTKSFTD